MRVLLVHNRYQTRGGEDVCVDAEKALLERYGHAVYMEQADNAEIVGPWRAAKVGFNSTYSWRSRQQVLRAIKEFSPEIVHVHNFFPQFTPSIYDACVQNALPIVQTLHNYRLLCPSANFFREGRVCEDCLGRAVAWPGIVHGCYRRSHIGTAAVAGMLAIHHALGTWYKQINIYIALTEFSKRKFVEGGLPPTKIALKPNFVDPDPEVGSGAGDFVLYVGRLSEEKGIRTLLDAWALLGERIKLKIVGSGPLTALVAQGSPRGVQFLGSMSRSDVLELMGQAKAVIFSSECYETFGLVIIESFAKGTPVIASKLGVAESLVRDQETGLHFKATDPVDLAHQVGWALEHPMEWQRMRRRAREEYVSKYTADKNYSTLIDIYLTAIQQNASGIKPTWTRA